MAKQKLTMNPEVTKFLDEQAHPLRNEIEQLRSVILSTNSTLSENIKWNGPNYCFNNEDRITMKIHPPKAIQLIFHRGAKVQTQPKEKLIQDTSNLLQWKSNDRAIATFKSMEDIKTHKKILSTIVNEWLIAADK